MGLFNKFLKPKQGQATPKDTPDFCYGIAYFMIPQILFSDQERILRYFREYDNLTGTFLYVMACKAQNIEPDTELAKKFKSHTGQLSDGRTYHVVEYPEMPPVNPDPFKMTLAPYFSAILISPMGDVSYYILSQQPSGGTTLRTVSGGGVNANLGDGSEPELSAFLRSLEARG